MNAQSKAAVLAAMISTMANAQSLNIDVGDGAGVPSASYAAAGLPGVWNLATIDLVGLDGEPIAATLKYELDFFESIDDPGTTGDDERLLDDYIDHIYDICVTAFCFEGLQNGTYDVITYAWRPSCPDEETVVAISPECPKCHSQKAIGGAWPGGLLEGVTHARDTVEVTDGTLDVCVFAPWVSSGSVNGVQLVHHDDLPAIWYVDDDGDPANGCTSWQDACPDMQDALDLVDAGDQIWVAAGTYTPDRNTGNRNAVFELISGVAVYGGFDGTEKCLSKRTGLFDETILSGDLNYDDEEPVTIESDCCGGRKASGCDDDTCEQNVCTVNPFCCSNAWTQNCTELAAALCCELCSPKKDCDNSYHVVTTITADPTAVLDGFTITAGNANGFGQTDDSFGGGWLNHDGSPTVRNCTFLQNAAKPVAGYSGGGGGMYSKNGHPTLIRCTFDRNIASGSSAGGGGFAGRDATIIDSLFIENAAGGGGGLFLFPFDPTSALINCKFIENSAEVGAGAVGIIAVFADFDIINCLFLRNTAGFWGGGLYGYKSNTNMVNCTFGGNTAVQGGGIYSDESYENLTNCILWGNSDDDGMGESSQITLGVNSDVLINYSCVQGWTGKFGGIGNIGDDPLFVDATAGNLRLRFDSPCIDAGDPGFVPEPGETELDGHARVLCGRVDMGGYEFGIGDFDCDRIIDLFDYASWDMCLTGPNAGPFDEGCEAFDFDGDLDVDLVDFGAFQTVFHRNP